MQHHQRARLEKAMVAAVAQRGYGETTVTELVRLAGVSKTTFYHHFESKEECFLTTFDTIVDDVTARVEVAYSSEASSEDRLGAAFAKFNEIICGETAAASLVIVDSLGLGAAAVPHLEQAAETFARMLRRSFVPDSGGHVPSDLQVWAVVAGVRTVVYRCLRTGRPEELAEHLYTLRAWALCYAEGSARDAVASPRPPGLRKRAAPDPEIGWDEPADSPRSRAGLTQRERIMRAAAQVATRVGYSHLTITAISAAAGTSNQTFYEHFDSKEEAFIAAFKELSARALQATYSAAIAESGWHPAVEAGVRGFLEHIAAEPLFARLAFFELPAAGNPALDHADSAIWRFAAFLAPESLPEDLRPLPPVIAEAVGGGMWAVIQHELAAGRPAGLPELAGEIADIARIPLRRQSAWPPPARGTA